MNPWLAILVVLGSLGLAFVAAWLLGRCTATNPELLRKLVHVAMGLVATTFPWLFERTWPVFLLAGTSLGALLILRRGLGRTRSFQGVLHGVQRSSWGELLFPVAVALLFALTQGDPLLYCVPLLILTLADAVAALIGVYYGQLPFSTLEGCKSVEGSLAFFMVTFFCVHVTVLLCTGTGRLESLLIGLLMGVIVMMFEAVAWRGLDNLFIPVSSYALLRTYLGMDSATLSLRLVVLCLLGLFLLLWRRRTTLDDSALIGAVLVAYGAWALGGLLWLLVPLSVFVVLSLLTSRVELDGREHIHNVYALLGIAGPAFFWLLLDHDRDSPPLLVAFAVAFSAHVTMLGISRAHYGRRHLAPGSFILAVFQGMLVLLVPFLFVWGLDRHLVQLTVLGGCAMVLAGLAFLLLQPGLIDCPGTPRRWARQALIAAGLSLLAWGGMQIQFVGELP